MEPPNNIFNLKKYVQDHPKDVTFSKEMHAPWPKSHTLIVYYTINKTKLNNLIWTTKNVGVNRKLANDFILF